jgi:hypothetical protein
MQRVLRILASAWLLLAFGQAGGKEALTFENSGQFGEWIARFQIEPEVKVHVNMPDRDPPAEDKPVLLILYALPNGNTTEQTIGRRLHPGDDWHFDIQHIGAQTRWLRQRIPDRTIVVAYLEAESKSWPSWCRTHGEAGIPGIVDRIRAVVGGALAEVVLTGHSGGGRFLFGYLNSMEGVPDDIVRIAFLDSNYGYDVEQHHDTKLLTWLEASSTHYLCVLAYHDSIALLDGEPFVSAEGGTWGRSHAMLEDLGSSLTFTARTNSAGLRIHTAMDGRVQLLLKENPEKRILHTVQVERNGFIHAMVLGTPLESKGYEYLGERAYTEFIANHP